jgi:hypothetical protein
MDGEGKMALTPDLVGKTEAINDGRGNQQIVFFKFAFLHFGLSDIEGGNSGYRDSRIFHATSTLGHTLRAVGLTRVNVIRCLFGLKEQVVRVRALEGGCQIGEILGTMKDSSSTHLGQP